MPGHPASVVRSVALLLPLLASILVAGALSAQCELPRLGVGETAPSARFGSAIDFSAEWAAVGAPNRDFAGSDSGAVHLFRRDGDSWVREARIAGSDTAAGDSFGASLALQGDILVVGAPHHAAAGPYSGAVYVFRLTGDGWVEEVKLLPDTVAELERFGLSVAIDGDAIVVGSSRDRNSEGVDTGSVTVFRHTDAWSVEALLFAPDGAHLDYFGIDVAISGDRLIAGAGGDDDFGSSSGAVYVFQHDATGWSFEAKLTGSDIDTNDRLGLRVDLEGTTVAAGAPGQAGLGAVYLFTLEGDAWIEAQKLQPAGLEIDDFFGYPVKLDGDRLAVGALEAGDHEGAVHVFLRSGQEWIAEATVTPFDAMSGDRFGHGIAIAGDEMLVGTRWRADAGISSGAVYQLNSVAGDWIAGMKLSPVDAEEGDRRGAAIAGDGQRLAIGAPGDSEGTSRRGIGSVRVFSADGPLWFEEARLTASDAASLDGLGEALAIAASLIVAGAP
ncbi:MAG: hypothetical protein ACE5GW_14175, partial [Planctomycetota bacterium]